MQPNRSEYSNRRQYSDRSSRLWNDYDHRWEEKHEPHRDVPKDSYQKYGGNGSKEKTSRGREYSDSPKMLYSKGSLNRDMSRKISARRRMSSPDWGTFEKKRQRFAEDDRDDRDDRDDKRYRLEPEDNTNRLSPDCFSLAHATKDFKPMLPQEEAFKYRKTPQDSRHKYVQEDFTYKQQHDDSRQSSGYYKDRVGHERSRDCSQERKQSRDRSKKSYVKPKERNVSPTTDHEEYRQSIARFPLNESCGQPIECVTNRSPAVPERKSTMGFQRFLNVLNKGVNVATLTKIVTQTSTEVGDRPCSTTSFKNTDHPWSPGYAGGQQVSHQSTSHWSESEGSQRLASSQHRHRSFSPKGRSLSDGKSLQRGDAERSYFSSNSRSRSPSAEKKITLTPEDEHKHKHRQMQDVLQAIGMNLGSEELGQMSNRIQERLYGKKDSDRHRKRSRERDTRQAFSPTPHSRSSSSSRSSFSPLNQDYYKKKDSYNAQSDVTVVHRVQAHEGVEYGQSSTLQESDKCETYSKEGTAACQTLSQNSAYAFFKPSPTSVMPVYSPGNCSSQPYPPLPPNLPLLGPRLCLPPFPPFFPYPHVPPVSIFPAVVAQTRHLLPQHISNPPFFNLPGMKPVQSYTTHKYKPLSRPRCLQVIETKQPG